MCGLIGYVSNFSGGIFQNELGAFEQMLYVDALRGFDSTGVFTVNRDMGVEGLKSSHNALAYIASKQWGDEKKDILRDGLAIFGHNRKATKGAITDDNSHPFVVGDIVLMHNGSLRQDHKQFADVEVDSHAIAHLLSQETVQDAVNKLVGAYALIWYDKRDESINIVRNNERPLSMVKTNSGWWFGSEAGMLKWILERSFTTGGMIYPNDVPINVHRKFTRVNNNWVMNDTPVKKEEPATQVNFHASQAGRDFWEAAAAEAANQEIQDTVGGQPQTVVETPMGNVAARVKTSPSEKVLAQGYGLKTTLFSSIAGARHLHKGSWIIGSAINWEWRNDKDHKEGAFLYGLPDEKSLDEFLIRCPVTYSDNVEQVLIDLVIDGADVAFQYATKSWHPYDKNEVNVQQEGYAILYCTDYATTHKMELNNAC